MVIECLFVFNAEMRAAVSEGAESRCEAEHAGHWETVMDEKTRAFRQNFRQGKSMVRVYIDSDTFLKPIKSVRIAYA